MKSDRASYIRDNLAHHEKAFSKQGYGISFPEGHVIRLYERLLKHEYGMTGAKGERMLDFGCGTGAHAEYFASKGFAVWGVDADPTAIEGCRERMPKIAANFAVVDAKPSETTRYFGVQYDFILANQVLYYFSDADLDRVLSAFHRQLKPGGILAASMMGTKHRFHKFAQKTKDGLSLVEVKGRSQSRSYINFTGTKAQLVKKFKLFELVTAGFYDFQVRPDEPSSFHHLFIGKKK